MASSSTSSSSSDEKELDPYSCLSKKFRKYAVECEEVYLANCGGTRLSESFKDFVNLEVVWFNNNRLTRIENLDPCFRIREMYLQNNRLVSLQFLKGFKFLRVFLASNNQIKNLDKQLSLISRLSFLKKLDLFDNSIADEPDYRLRMIYHAPQVEILDRLGVTFEQRQRAEEVVPNMDKVAAAKPVQAPKKAYSFTQLERDCFRTSKAVKTERQRIEDDSLKTQVFSKGISYDAPAPKCRALREHAEHWSSAANIAKHEMHNPTPWEKQWTNDHHGSLQAQVEELARGPGGDREELNKQDVIELARQLHEEGIEDFGRALVSPDVFAPRRAPSHSASMTDLRLSRRRQVEPVESSPSKNKPHLLESLMADEEATMPVKEVAEFLVSLPWHRLSDDQLNERIKHHNHQVKLACLRATFGVSDIKFGEDGDDQVFFKCRDKVARLEGLKTRKSEVGLLAKPPAPILRKSRSDVFSQSFIKTQRVIDDATGKSVLQVGQGGKHTPMCVR